MAACDTLLQELNTVYAYDLALNPEDVRWNKKNKKSKSFMDKLPEEILNLIEAERRKDWFYEVRHIRNTATHHYTVPLSSGTIWVSDILNYTEHDVRINYFDNAGNRIQEDIKVCPKYLQNMVGYISSVWEKIAQEFQ